MAAKKTTKRSAAKKRPTAKRGSAKKKPARKPTRAKATQAMTRQARKGLKAARGGLDTVFKAGEKTWKTLKSTTAQVVEGVRESLAGESEPASKRPRPR